MITFFLAATFAVLFVSISVAAVSSVASVS